MAALTAKGESRNAMTAEERATDRAGRNQVNLSLHTHTIQKLTDQH